MSDGATITMTSEMRGLMQALKMKRADEQALDDAMSSDTSDVDRRQDGAPLGAPSSDVSDDAPAPEAAPTVSDAPAEDAPTSTQTPTPTPAPAAGPFKRLSLRRDGGRPLVFDGALAFSTEHCSQAPAASGDAPAPLRHRFELYLCASGEVVARLTAEHGDAEDDGRAVHAAAAVADGASLAAFLDAHTPDRLVPPPAALWSGGGDLDQLRSALDAHRARVDAAEQDYRALRAKLPLLRWAV